MPLDPQVKTYLDQMAALNAPPMDTLSPQVVREGYRQGLDAFSKTVLPDNIANVEDRMMPGAGGDLPLRVYTPRGDGPFPILMYFHGGGWVIGDLDTHDVLCRDLASGVGCLVVAVDYRLAPEHPFPAAPDDCFAATRWAAEHADDLNGDPARLAVGGDSAGGNLATVTALQARDAGGPPLVFQLLVYPGTDMSMSAPSVEENAEGYGLGKRDMVWFGSHYLQDNGDRDNPLASPLAAPSLKGLPPALVVTAEYDPLRDEGEAYGRKLQADGVLTTITRYDGMIHGFFTRAAVTDRSKDAIEEAAAALRGAFAQGRGKNV